MKRERIGEFEELVLLAVAQLADDAHSVAIQSVLEEQAGRFTALGSIYAALDRLHRKGFVSSWLAEPEPKPGGRRKRHYGLTREGHDALEEVRRVREGMWRRVGSAPR